MSMEVSGRRDIYGSGYEEKLPKRQKEDKTEETTVSTDSVDSEISRLKEEKRRLEQQVRMAGDGKEAERLRRLLRQVEGEVRQKDNDAYRKGHVDVKA